MRKDCDICGGRGKIRLPVLSNPDASAYRQRSIAIQHVGESSREYTCPECSEVADDNRVMVAWSQQEYPAHYDRDPDFMRSLEIATARHLADLMIKDGYVRFVEDPVRDDRMTKALRAYVGVVAVGAAKRIEDRISERQFDVANEVIANAAEQIRFWDSRYTGPEGHINKGQAIGEMKAALMAAKQRREETA